jgi:hypothetical protein
MKVKEKCSRGRQRPKWKQQVRKEVIQEGETAQEETAEEELWED